MDDKLRLEAHLQRLGWSQNELGRRLGVSGVSIGRWMNGKVRVPRYVWAYCELAERFADIFDELSDVLKPDDGRRV